MLVTTLLIMGVAAFMIGLLPTYEQIGVLAPILLVLLRVFQSFGVGGEWGGAVLMAVEHSPPGRRGFYGSWPQMGVPAGLLLGTGVMYLFATLPEEAFLAWGWRVPFLFSIVLVGVGLYIRLAIEESPVFQRVRQTDATARMPIVDVLRTYPRSVLIAIGLRFAENGAFYVFTVFVLTYVTTQLGLPNSLALLEVMIAVAIELFTIPFFGSLSDCLGRRPVYLFGAGATLLFAFPFFWFVNTGVGVFIWLAIVLALVEHAAMYGTQGAFFSELFGIRARYSGASLGYQLASVFAGGLSPIIALTLLSWSGSYWPVALYRCFMALVTLAAVFFATEPSGTTSPTTTPKNSSLSPRARAQGSVSEALRTAYTAKQGKQARGPASAGLLTRGTRRGMTEMPMKMPTSVNLDLAGKTAFVTGAASGIGRACATRLAAAGAEVTVADVNGEKVRQAAEEIGASPIEVDLSDYKAVDSLGIEADILVNNAGIQHVAAVEDFDPERFSFMMRLMLETPFRLAHQALPGMYGSGWGRVINISSVHGLRASPFKSAYIAAKHGLEGLSKVIALEGGPKGVTSNCICPAYVRTPLVEGQIADQARTRGISEKDVIEKVMLTGPAIKRLVEPEEVAEMVAFLCTDAASFITGAALTMDGAATAQW